MLTPSHYAVAATAVPDFGAACVVTSADGHVCAVACTVRVRGGCAVVLYDADTLEPLGAPVPLRVADADADAADAPTGDGGPAPFVPYLHAVQHDGIAACGQTLYVADTTNHVLHTLDAGGALTKPGAGHPVLLRSDATAVRFPRLVGVSPADPALVVVAGWLEDSRGWSEDVAELHLVPADIRVKLQALPTGLQVVVQDTQSLGSSGSSIAPCVCVCDAAGVVRGYNTATGERVWTWKWQWASESLGCGCVWGLGQPSRDHPEWLVAVSTSAEDGTIRVLKMPHAPQAPCGDDAVRTTSDLLAVVEDCDRLQSVAWTHNSSLVLMCGDALVLYSCTVMN